MSRVERYPDESSACLDIKIINKLIGVRKNKPSDLAGNISRSRTWHRQFLALVDVISIAVEIFAQCAELWLLENLFRGKI